MPDDLLIKNASELVTCSGFKAKRGREMSDLHIIEDGAVYIQNGAIQMVGTTEQVLGQVDESDCRIVDASGKAVLASFQGRRLVVTPTMSYLLDGAEVTALDRLAYTGS